VLNNLYHFNKRKIPATFLYLFLSILMSVNLAFAEQSTSNLDEIVKAAAKAGVQVVIVNPDSKVIAEPASKPAIDQRSDLATFRSDLDEFRNEAQAFISLLPEAREEMISILRNSNDENSIFYFVKMVAMSLLFFAIGYKFTVELYGKRIVGPWFIAKQIDNPVGYSEKLPILVTRFLLGIGGIFVTMLVAYIIDSLIYGKSKAETEMLTIGYIYFAYGMINLIVLFWRMILSPFLPNYRIPKFHPANLDECNKAAKQLYIWLLIGSTLGISFNLLISWLGELGVSPMIYGVLNLYLTGIAALFSIALVIVNKPILNGAILLGKNVEDASLPARVTIKFWTPFAILYFIVAWLDLAYNLIKGNETRLPVIASAFIIIISVIVVYAIVSYIIEQFFQRRRKAQQQQTRNISEELLKGADDSPLQEGEELLSSHIPEEQVAQSSLITFEDLATRVASMLAFVAGFYALLNVWNAGDVLESNSFIHNSYDVIFILFFGYIAYNFFKIWIDNRIAAEGGGVELKPGDEGGAGGASRLATLLPLFRNFLLVLIFVSVTLIALTEMGINVAPLFAGAGVVGLAIGFGAQTLVRDVFSGAFFLFDDAFRKGEYIDLGDVKGTVEKVSVRSFQLRHHLGRLHTVPFGEIKFLTNYSRDWVMMKLPLRVTYDTDIEKVRKLVKKLGQRMLEDPELGPQFLQPLKSQGVIEMQDSAMIIRVKFMTKPGDQWVIRKTVYAKIRELFVQEGIKFAHKEVTVRLADKQLDELPLKQKHEIAGAAALLSQEELTSKKDQR
jgi:small-conductance mechanosensitive channel